MSPDSNKTQGKPELLTFELFERAAKMVIVLIGILYAIGLFITNFYLSSIGVSDFSSIKPKYIVTGSWSLLIFLLGALPSIFFMLAWHENKVSGNNMLAWRSIVWLLFCIIIGLYFDWKGYTYLMYSLHVSHSASFLNKTMWTCTGLASIAVSNIWYNHREQGNAAGLTSKLMTYASSVIFVGLGLALYALILIAKNVYIQVPEALGGGKPIAAELIFNSDGYAFWKQVGTGEATSSSQPNGSRVLILYHDEHEFVIKTQYKNGNDKIVFLNKSLVQGFLPKAD